ncbi:MAG: DUF2339 domain-containing protein [Rhodospirillaceae bacterium]|nr:DUF2339 domain-containing protein [Rhodospirillaceae bacterium]
MFAALFALGFLIVWWLELAAMPHGIGQGTRAHLALVPEYLQVFGGVTAAFAALFGFGGFMAQRRAGTPAFWASLSAGMPLLLAMFLYAVAWNFAASAAWATMALGMAGLGLFMTDHMLRRAMQAGAGAYAAATSCALAIAMAVLLRESWLTVGLAAMLPALAWVHARFGLLPLRWVASVITAIVSVRLLTNPSILTYAADGLPTWLWVLYGYGLPALSYLIAARLLGNRRDDPLVLSLQAGCMAFVIALQVLEFRLLIGGGFEASLSLAEVTLHGPTWLGMSVVLARSRLWTTHPIFIWGGRLLLVGSTAALVGGSLVAFNPLWTHEPVGAWPFLNLLGLAFGAPAILYAWLSVTVRRHGQAISPRWPPVCRCSWRSLTSRWRFGTCFTVSISIVAALVTRSSTPIPRHGLFSARHCLAVLS